MAVRPNTPIDKVRELQRKLYVSAKRSRTRRFHALYDRICRSDVLREAWKRNRAIPRASDIAKTVGKPCAGNPHARFERGIWKRGAVTAATAPEFYQ